MRASVLLGILLVFGSVAHESAAQPADIHCPKPGTRLTYSNGGRIEAVSDQGNYVCRFRNMATQTTFDRFFGAFVPTGPHAAQIRSLAPFEVGHKIRYTNSGADVLGGDGVWFHDVSIERFENVVTVAGTFSAYVILDDDQTIQSSHGRWQQRFWYSPEVGHVVKFEYQTLNGSPPPNYPKNWELTAYAPSGTASTPVQAVPASPASAPAPAPVPAKIAAAAPPAPTPVPAKAAVVSAPTAEPTRVATAKPLLASRDGSWTLDMQVITSNGNAVGGECQPHPSVPLTFVNGNAEDPSTELHLTSDGGISGWMLAPSIGTSAVPFTVSVSGRLKDGAFTGSISGRCIGSFTMKKQ